MPVRVTQSLMSSRMVGVGTRARDVGDMLGFVQNDYPGAKHAQQRDHAEPLLGHRRAASAENSAQAKTLRFSFGAEMVHRQPAQGHVPYHLPVHQPELESLPARIQAIDAKILAVLRSDDPFYHIQGRRLSDSSRTKQDQHARRRARDQFCA